MMMTFSQHERLKKLQDKPWHGPLNYFRSLKADWDALEDLGDVTPRLVSDLNGVVAQSNYISHGARFLSIFVLTTTKTRTQLQ